MQQWFKSFSEAIAAQDARRVAELCRAHGFARLFSRGRLQISCRESAFAAEALVLGEALLAHVMEQLRISLRSPSREWAVWWGNLCAVISIVDPLQEALVVETGRALSSPDPWSRWAGLRTVRLGSGVLARRMRRELKSLDNDPFVPNRESLVRVILRHELAGFGELTLRLAEHDPDQGVRLLAASALEM